MESQRIKHIKGSYESKEVGVRMNQKRSYKMMFLCGLILTIIIGYYIAAAATKGGTVFTWYDRLVEIVWSNPLKNYWNAYTTKSILICVVAYILLFMVYVTGQKNLMPGREMGSAKFGDIVAANRKLSDPNHDLDDPANIVIIKRVYPAPIQLLIQIKKQKKGRV